MEARHSVKRKRAIAEIGCIVCLRCGNAGTPAEIHHLRAGVGAGQRNDDYHAIPLCHIHHRTGGYGIAFHAGKKEWEKTYGSEEELLDALNALVDNQ